MAERTGQYIRYERIMKRRKGRRCATDGMAPYINSILTLTLRRRVHTITQALAHAYIQNYIHNTPDCVATNRSSATSKKNLVSNGVTFNLLLDAVLRVVFICRRRKNYAYLCYDTHRVTKPSSGLDATCRPEVLKLHALSPPVNRLLR